MVPAPGIDSDGKPMRRRAAYPASEAMPSTEPPERLPNGRIRDAAPTPQPEVSQPEVSQPEVSQPEVSRPAQPQSVEPSSDEAGVPPGSDKPTTKQRMRSWAETVAVFVVGLVLALVVRAFLLQAFSIPSDSMVPTLVRGDRVVVWKPSDTISDLDRGDVAVFKRPNVASCPFSPDDPDDLIKRVVGLPGETISSPSGQLLVDGVPVDESYLPDATQTDMAEPIVVPDGKLLMLGDNRGFSKDGRCFGPIPEDAVVGRATARVWPPGRIGGL